MTKILPFKAYRYTSKAGKLSDLVISQSDNGQNLKPPAEFSLSQLVNAKDPQALFEKWKNKGIIRQDLNNSIYIFRQEYYSKGELLIKKGFISKIALGIENLSSILEHEHVNENGINYHLDILTKTQLTIHPIMGMYSDEHFQLEKYLEESFRHPISVIPNDSGGTDTFGMIDDIAVIEEFVKILSTKKIFLADGHHRYHASIKHSNLTLGNTSQSTIIYLSNMEDRNFKVFPYHRLYQGIEDLNENIFINFLRKYFYIDSVDLSALPIILDSQKFKLGVLLKEKTLLLTLKEDKKALLMRSISSGKHFINFSIIKEKILTKGLKLSSTQALFNVEYEVNFALCSDKVLNGNAQLAIISPNITSKELKMIAEKRIVLPEKTTFFFPKAVSGIVYHSIKEDEALL